MQQAAAPQSGAFNPPATSQVLTLTHVDTPTAARMMGFAENTLRKWHCLGTGPIKPVRVRGRLRWAVAEINRVLSEGA